MDEALSHAVVPTVSGAFVVQTSGEREDRVSIFYDRREAEKEAARRNRERCAELATAALDLAFGYEEESLK